MSIIDFFRGIFRKTNRFSLDESKIWEDLMSRAATETAVRELALTSAVNLIANTVSKCEFKTFQKGTEKKDDEYYLWNVRPNANENSAQFIQKLIYHLCVDNECLVVFINNDAFVADTFALKEEYAIRPNVYTGVSINNLALSRDFVAEEVLHYKLNNEEARRLLDMFYSSYKQLIDSATKAFTRSRGERGVLETARLPGAADYEEIVRKMMNDYFKPYFNSDNAVVPLFEGQKYTKTSTTGTREITEAGDTRKLIDDVFDVTARAFRIPPALLRGEMADTSTLMTNYLTFCIDPLCDMLSKEINAKRYNKARFLEGNYLKIDTSSVKHVDLLDSATAIDKLISSGTVNINELRASIGMPPVNKPWAREHYITKNYTQIDALEGR